MDALPLRSSTSGAWAASALADPRALLDDHAHLERKAASNALALLSGAPAGLGGEAAARWTATLAAVARDETEHLVLVLRALARRGGTASRRHRNPYAAALHALARPGGAARALDHLLVCALIEARSCERFEALVRAGPDPDLAALYRGLASSERGHHRVFLDLAASVAGEPAAARRWAQLLDAEATVLAAQPPGPRMHSGEPARA